MGGTILRIDLKNPDEGWKLVHQYGGEVCQEQAEQKRLCGRPLGMDFDAQGRLVVADAFMGVYRVDVDKGPMEVIHRI